MQRRNFIRRAALTLASAAGAVLGISMLKQITRGKARSSRRVKVGELSDFPVDNYTFIEDQKIFIYRDHEGIKAVSAVCTHLGCIVQHTEDGFECPCHGSCYDEEGEVTSGPAPTALAWYKVEKSADGNFIVDLDQKTEASEKFRFA